MSTIRETGRVPFDARLLQPISNDIVGTETLPSLGIAVADDSETIAQEHPRIRYPERGLANAAWVEHHKGKIRPDHVVTFSVDASPEDVWRVVSNFLHWTDEEHELESLRDDLALLAGDRAVVSHSFDRMDPINRLTLADGTTHSSGRIPMRWLFSEVDKNRRRITLIEEPSDELAAREPDAYRFSHVQQISVEENGMGGSRIQMVAQNYYTTEAASAAKHRSGAGLIKRMLRKAIRGSGIFNRIAVRSVNKSILNHANRLRHMIHSDQVVKNGWEA